MAEPPTSMVLREGSCKPQSDGAQTGRLPRRIAKCIKCMSSFSVCYTKRTSAQPRVRRILDRNLSGSCGLSSHQSRQKSFAPAHIGTFRRLCVKGWVKCTPRST